MYPKIENVYMRDEQTHKLSEGQYKLHEFRELATIAWEWTEKIDGMNVRVIWDGENVQFRGRTDKAQMPPELTKRLEVLFPPSVEVFGPDPMTLYGEGFGKGIQKGGHLYSETQDFVLFDVCVGGWWLLPEDVQDVSEKMGCLCVPAIGCCGIREAVDHVRGDGFDSKMPGATRKAEGVVGRAPYGMRLRNGNRIMVKIKTKDLP